MHAESSIDNGTAVFMRFRFAYAVTADVVSLAVHLNQLIASSCMSRRCVVCYNTMLEDDKQVLSLFSL